MLPYGIPYVAEWSHKLVLVPELTCGFAAGTYYERILKHADEARTSWPRATVQLHGQSKGARD